MVATRARIVLWRTEGRPKKEVAALAGVSLPTVDLWLGRYDTEGVAGLRIERGAPRSRCPADTGADPGAEPYQPAPETGLSHWSSREMAAYVTRTEGVYVSYHYVAKLWRASRIKPHRSGTFKLSRPAFAEKVADVVGLYLDPRAPRGTDDSSGGEKPSPPGLSQQER